MIKEIRNECDSLRESSVRANRQATDAIKEVNGVKSALSEVEIEKSEAGACFVCCYVWVPTSGRHRY